jgi:type 2 lantibiotic biosynthesis protein LanM
MAAAYAQDVSGLAAGLGDRDVPFAAALSPFVRAAADRLRAGCPAFSAVLSVAAQDDLLCTLLRRLSAAARSTLLLEFRVFRQLRTSGIGAFQSNSVSDAAYRAFTEHLIITGCERLFREYPLLADLFDNLTQDWLDFAIELASAIEADLPLLRAEFGWSTPSGPALSARADLSDLHRNGRSVVVFTFPGDIRIVYKPRRADVEQAFGALLSWTAQAGFPLTFAAPRIVRSGSHAWSEYIARTPCASAEGVERYYQRCGALLCLLHVLRATDCHRQNIVARGEHPVIVDAETLLHPRLSVLAEHFPDDSYAHSLLPIGMLPRWERVADGRRFDTSGLSNPSARPREKWHDVNLDTMHCRVEDDFDDARNLPSLHGRVVPVAGYEDAVVHGFDLMHSFLRERMTELLDADGPLQRFADVPARYVLRSTRAYGRLLRGLSAPSALRSTAVRERVLASLDEDVGDVKRMAPVLAAERAALVRRNIPLFHALSDGTSLYVGDDAVLPRGLRSSGLDECAAVLRGLSEDDLPRHLLVIRDALAGVTSNAGVGGVPPQTELLDLHTLCLDLADRVASDLERTAVRDSSGVTWLATADSKSRDVPLGHGLYGGRVGIALFLASFTRVTGDERSRALAHSAIRPALGALTCVNPVVELRSLECHDAGAAGLLMYGLTRVAQDLADAALLRHLIRLAHAFAVGILPCVRHDVLGGCAGALFGLLALYDATGDALVLERASEFAAHLVEHTAAESAAATLRGFAHGNAGRACALLRYARRAHDAHAATLACSLLSADAAGTPPADTLANSWCRGSAGIGSACLEAVSSGRIEFEAALAQACAEAGSNLLSAADSFCCGNAGRIDFLCGAADLGASAERRRAAGSLIRQVFSADGVLAMQPTLFRGQSGVAYSALRLASEGILPSLTSFSV